MSEIVNNSVNLEDDDLSFDFKQFIQLLYFNWYWFIVSIVVCVLIAFVYVWFTPTIKTISNKMQIIDNKGQSSSANAKAAVLNSLPLGLGSSFGGSLGIETEKEILKSKTLIRDVVNELGLYTEYSMSNWGRKTVIYKFQPLIVSIDPAHLKWMDDELLTKYHQIDLTICKSSNVYVVETTLILGKDETELPPQTFNTLPATLKTEFGTLTITENATLSEIERKRYFGDFSMDVTIIPPMTCAKKMASRLKLEAPSKKVVNMLTISFSDENHIRGIDFVNSLVEHYNKRANNEKNEEVMRNEEFVNNRMAKLDKEMGSSDAAWENSKKSFQITSPEVDAKEISEKKSVYETQLVTIGTELKLHDYLSEYVNDPANLFENIPSAALSSGVSSIPETSSKSSSFSLISEHNGLVSMRRDLLRSVSDKSPQIQRVEQSISELHPVIQTALKRDRQQLLIRQSTLQREYGKYMGRVGTAPQMERVLTEIGRERNIKQSVYLLMLQKREEAALELAKSAIKGKLIDETQVVGPSKPQKKIVFLVAFGLGTLLPIGLFYLLQLFKQRIDTRAELEVVAKHPILGEIPLHENHDAIRALRTNLLLNLKDGQKVILVASNNDGDGKSFISQCLAESLNAIGKKTFLIDGDLRSSPRGGHPADILASESFAKEVSMAKADNDYVIFDSPAMSQYADAYQLATFADATLFIAKAQSTDKSVIKGLNKDSNLPNILLALNAIDTTKKNKLYKN